MEKPSKGTDSTTTVIEPVGTTILDDQDGLAPRLAAILRNVSGQVAGAGQSTNDLRRSDGAWPSTVVETVAGTYDGAGRPGRTETTVTRGVFRTRALRISTQTTDGVRLMRSDPATYLLAVARLLEGGDGPPDPRDLRRLAVASALCDQDPLHVGDLVVLPSATAFEPAFLYDEGFRGAGRTDSRILPIADHLADMLRRLPRLTRVTVVRNAKGVPVVGVAPYADKALGDLSHEDLELVGWTTRAV